MRKRDKWVAWARRSWAVRRGWAASFARQVACERREKKTKARGMEGERKAALMSMIQVCYDPSMS